MAGPVSRGRASRLCPVGSFGYVRRQLIHILAAAALRESPAMRDTFVQDRLPPPELLPEFRFDRPELNYPERLNAAAHLVDRRVAIGRGADLAIVNDLGEWSYADLKSHSDRIAHILVHREGLISGNRVLLRGPNGAMMFACWLGILKAGGVVVATMPMLRAGEIRTIIEKAEISHALIDDRFIADYDAAGCCASTLSYHGDRDGGMLEALIAEAPEGFAAADTGSDDPAMIAFTSGTTGEPKGCIQFHRDILAVNDSFARHIIAAKAGDRFLSSAPIAFTFGLGALVIFPFAAGVTAVTVEQGAPDILLEAIARHRVTTLFTAPAAYKAMLARLDGHNISTLHTCVSAGEHLPEAIWHGWHETTGLKIINGIGATELMHIFISAAGDDIRCGATGKIVPGFTACVLDEDGNELASGEGRLAVKGPTGCRYLADPRQSRYVENGWNVTGDTYRLDDEGYFWYVARSDDMIVSSGYNIGAPEVENALLAHPAVAECAVIGVPCPERGTKVKAFVVAARSELCGPALAKHLQDHVKSLIAPYKYPREIEFVESLPKTLTGKLQRFALRNAP